MKFIKWLTNRRKPAELDEDLQKIEADLNKTFTIVEPHPKFIKYLRQDLMKQIPSLEISPVTLPYQNLQTGVLVTGGVLGSIFVLLTGVRGLISLIGVVCLLISWLRQTSEDSLKPTDLAHG